MAEPPISMTGPSARPALTHSAAAPTARATRTTTIFHMGRDCTHSSRDSHWGRTRITPGGSMRDERRIALALIVLALSAASDSGAQQQSCAGSDCGAATERVLPPGATTASVLWQPSMNVFRRFDVPAERMYEFYGAVLGF